MSAPGGDWEAYLRTTLGTQANLLSGCKQVQQQVDSRFVLQAPSKGARRELVAALRTKGGPLKVSPFLSTQERDNKGAAYAFARARGLEVSDQGDVLAMRPKGSVGWTTAMTVALSAT